VLDWVIGKWHQRMDSPHGGSLRFTKESQFSTIKEPILIHGHNGSPKNLKNQY
jgi:hypothetical protein